MEKQAATVSAAKQTNSVDEELKKKLLNEYSHQSEDESLYPLKILWGEGTFLQFYPLGRKGHLYILCSYYGGRGHI